MSPFLISLGPYFFLINSDLRIYYIHGTMDNSYKATHIFKSMEKLEVSEI